MLHTLFLPPNLFTDSIAVPLNLCGHSLHHVHLAGPECSHTHGALAECALTMGGVRWESQRILGGIQLPPVGY